MRVKTAENMLSWVPLALVVDFNTYREGSWDVIRCSALNSGVVHHEGFQ